MRTLLFKNNVHNMEPVEIPGDGARAVNLTFRKGLKWSDLKIGDTVELRETGAPEPILPVDGAMPDDGNTDLVTATIYDVKVLPFRTLVNYPKMLQLAHDPECRNFPGLHRVMRRVYDGFLADEIVTLVFYEVNQ